MMLDYCPDSAGLSWLHCLNYCAQHGASEDQETFWVLSDPTLSSYLMLLSGAGRLHSGEPEQQSGWVLGLGHF